MLRTFIAVAVVLMCAAQGSRIIATTPTKHFELLTAAATGGYKTWAQAQAYCPTLSYGGYTGTLAMIKNAAENAAVSSFNGVSSRDRYLIGGHLVSGTWKWLDGTSFSTTGGSCYSGQYCNWNVGEPNGPTSTSTTLIMLPDGRWNDGPNLFSSPYEGEIVCEYPNIPTPEPVPATLDPAVTAFCDEIGNQCTAMSAECDTIRNGHGPVVGSGTMSNQAGNGGVGEHTGGVTLTGNTVVVTATGALHCSSTCPTSGPDGEGVAAPSNMVLPGVNRHSLLARIGAGPWQFIGAGPTTLTGTGALTFAFNDGNYPDNTGSWDITIRDDITNVADDCDASVTTCNEMQVDCQNKVANCPLV